MVMIVFHHFCVHGGFHFDYEVISIPRLWYLFLFAGGKIGVNIFVLISGYFLISDTGYTFNWKRIARFWGQVFFYSIIIIFVFTLIGIEKFDVKETIRALLPITFTRWWFASTYFVLYLLHPFLNRFLKSLDKRTHQVLLMCFLICWSIIPTFTRQGFELNNLLWFIALYCIAAYIRLYGLNPKFKCRHYFIMWIGFSVLTYLFYCIHCGLGIQRSIFALDEISFFSQEKITIVLISVSMFMTFATWRMPYQKWINVIGSTTFGVYLIHENYIIRSFLWGDVFKNASYQNRNMIIPYSIIVVTIVFVLCSLIDLIRQKTVERVYMDFVNRHIEKITKPFEIICERTMAVIFGEDERNQ